MKVNNSSEKVESFLERGAVEIIGIEELKQKMLSGRKLKAYIGYDVTGPNLHLGHASTMMKLRDWQELGHEVVLLIGDYTARVGDHSDKLDKRKRLTVKEIENNKKKFIEQFGKIVDLNHAEIRYNSEWLSKLSFSNIIELTSLFSVQQMSSRENFAKRFEENKTVGLEEFLYPIMQGFDTYTLKVDLQIGGVDQIFNMLAGRKIMKYYNVEQQSVMTMPLINGTDGRKMSKSWHNYVPIMASNTDLFGGIMSSVDDVIEEYLILLTRVDESEIAEMMVDLKNGRNPMEIKKKLALEITRKFFDDSQARKAQEFFENTFQKGINPQDIPVLRINEGSNISDLLEVLVKEKIISSNSEIRRLLNQKGMRLDDNVIKNTDEKLIDNSTLRIGKKRFFKIKFESR